MANIPTRFNKDGKPIYYGDFRIDGKRIRKTLSRNRKTAAVKLKKLEYELTFQHLKEPESPQILFYHLILILYFDSPLVINLMLSKYILLVSFDFPIIVYYIFYKHPLE